MPFNQGNKPASGARPTPGARPAPTKAPTSRYSGVQARGARLAYPPAGYYRFVLVESGEGYNPNKKRASNKTKVRVIATDHTDQTVAKPGDMFALTFLDTDAGVGEYKALCMAVTGYDPASQEADFDEASGEEQDLMAAVAGHANRFSEHGQVGIGRHFDCRVTRGGQVIDKLGADTGDYYRGYTFELVPEDEQEVPAIPEGPTESGASS